MMEGDYLRKKIQDAADDFTKLILSWSIDDILNDNMFIDKVENIPLTFESEQHYFSSFVYPLLEETRVEMASSIENIYRAPYAEVFSCGEVKDDGKWILYDITLGPWRKRITERGKEPYKTLPSDLLILVDGRPESVSDLRRVGRTLAFSLVQAKDNDNEDDTDSTSVRFKVRSSQQIKFQEGMFAVYVMNVTPDRRVYSSLQLNGNTSIIKELIYSDSLVKESCNICRFDRDRFFSENPNLLDKLNESQIAAIMASLDKTECCHNSYVEQIWGPPGTGKTTTVSVLLFILLKKNRRTLTCAPTSVAILQLASRVLSLVKDSFKTTVASGDSFSSLGDVLLFGNNDRLKIGTYIEEIFLEHRVKMLKECLGSLTGWKHCMRSMLDLLEDCVALYHIFVENETKTNKLEVKSFVEFLQDRFTSSIVPLRRCIFTFLTHIPRSFMKEYSFHSMIHLLDNISSFESMLFEENLVSKELEHLFNSKRLPNDLCHLSSIYSARAESISVLRALPISLEAIGIPSVLNTYEITNFCFERASLIFCTSCSSYKLHTVKMRPLNVLVIDEAAQLKEAESTIPLQLPGMKHAILIGDECQLPAEVHSNVSDESGFGRSLFDRLSSLGHSRHLLSVQYRMHPSISCFPNWKFYQNQILNAENVLCKSYEKQYLPGPMFGSYSFINVVGGREEKGDNGRSRQNMVEVALVIKIVKNLYKAWRTSKKELTIGVVSPYSAQIVCIKEKLAHKYKGINGFSVNLKSVDGFQGGEEDIIILSTVRSNNRGYVGFLSSLQRTNVSLTRARHCLWILGNERTLVDSESVWKDLVCDAKNRQCVFDAESDKCLKMTIIAAKKELDQLDDLVNENSMLFKNAKWKVLFSADFRKSFGMLSGSHLRKMVLNLLLKLSGGWRPKNRNVDLHCENSSQILKQFKVEGLYIICTIDVIKEYKYIQVLKVWDILPIEEIPKLTKRLENIFSAYTDDYINSCTTKLIEGNLEIPMSWLEPQEIIRFRYLRNNKGQSWVSENLGDGRTYVESSKVNESLLLMKFYSLSFGAVNHLLSGQEVELPMQVTDEQMDIILFSKSSFIIGRSGTGKTTILTMKLFQNEQSFRAASEGIFEVESSGSDSEVVDDSKPSVLRQLFVSVSPQLCYAVKQHVSHLTSHGNSSAETNLDYSNLTSEFKDIPDTLIGIPMKSYPLVITFRKFLMMLDGTLGNSFFKRFLEAREGSVSLKTIIRMNEVTFDKFCSNYWPHFNSNLTKGIDPSRVFTEIISHIKGGLQAGESHDGKLSFENYSLLSESRASTLTKPKRETVYTLFEAYEKMKTEYGEFDLGDLVNDIHRRLKNGSYDGDQMDFVYIDEVQDLSMRQISLFKYICQNVEEGFVFAGDTAQTIARGIDFRFQDIRSLFYKEFLTGKQEKRTVSDIFQLKQNFRTHAGVLELAQSVIDIIYCYFVHSIDKLEPEISLISGEAPVLLESGNDENAIVTIFGGIGSGGEMVGFGAEQVILVRDDNAKTEMCEYVGKHALVLTIVECKGLEFQDVLLYNFFGTSPLKDQWRFIYGYMKEHDWLDEKLPQSFPTFTEERHNVLCSELKQLYVAITRTRQRLWICENKEDLSKPMFDFWKKRGLVQLRKLDESVAQAMRVASSPQEWRERGKKLFYENNFVMATMCFERAGDTLWEKLAKASGLRASADQMRGTNHESFLVYLREAAGMFESIGKLESAASCYCDMGEFERAEKIYKCEKTDEVSEECSTEAGKDIDAAEAYAKVDELSDCLSAESGHFLDAAELARSLGDVLKEAYLLEKAGKCKEATDLLLWYLFFGSLWGNGNRGWPLKQFDQKEELCKKAMLLGEMDSDVYFDFVCSELKVFSDQPTSLSELNKDLHASMKNKSLRGEILSVRKILDSHFLLNSSKYDWEDELPDDNNQHCDVNIFANRVSATTLVFYWNTWKEKVLDIFSSLGSFHLEEPNEHGCHVDFCLNYFGVRKQCVKGNIIYLLVNKDAEWIRNASQNGLHWDGKLLTIDIRELVLAIKSFWQSELLSVGIKVLETLEGLHKSKSNNSAFHQSTSLLHIFEVSKFLNDCQCLDLTSLNKKKLKSFLEISTKYFDLVFPLDWRKSMSEDMISLRDTDLSVSLLEEIVLRNFDIKGDLTYWTIGRLMMICLTYRKPLVYFQMVTSGLQWNPAWNSFFEKICCGGLKDADVASELHNILKDTFRANWRRPGYISPHSFIYLLDSYLFFSSFSSRIIFTTRSSLVGWLTHFRSTATPATSLSASKKMLSNDDVIFIVETIKHILEYKEDTVAWIQRSRISPTSYHRLLALKLVMMLSLIGLQVKCSQLLLDLLSGRDNIAYLLPQKFVCDLLKRKKGRQLNLNSDVVAEAFLSVYDPLVIASSQNLRNDAICAIFVDLRKSKEEIMNVLYSKNNTNSGPSCSTNVDVKTICGQSSSSSSSSSLSSSSVSNKKREANLNVKPVDGSKIAEQQMTDFINGKKSPTVNLNALAKDEKDVVHDAPSDTEVVSSANTSEHTNSFMKSVHGAIESVQSLIPSVKDLFNGTFMSWETKVGNLGMSECSSTNNDAKNKKEKGDTKKKKSKKSKR